MVEPGKEETVIVEPGQTITQTQTVEQQQVVTEQMMYVYDDGLPDDGTGLQMGPNGQIMQPGM